MPQENRPETAREADLCRQLAQRINQLEHDVDRLKQRERTPPPTTPRLPGGGSDGNWMGG